MTKDEALKLALEALERCVATCFDPYAHEQAMSYSEHFVNQTITAIKEALAQPEQTPYITMPPSTPMWTIPPQRTWVGLTNDEIFEIHKQVDSMQYLTFGYAIENKLKQKNT